MSRLLSVSALATLLIVCAAASGGEGSEQPAGGTGASAPAHCTTYSTGSDAHTSCARPASAAQGSAIACHTYTVGSDTHAECAPVPASRLAVPRAQPNGPVMPTASTLRCYTYRIDSSTYTDCR